MIPYLLFYKIVQLFLVMLLGFLLVKLKIISPKDSKVLSKISLYLLMPAAILNAFQVEMTPQLKTGLFLAFLAAIGIHVAFWGIDRIYTAFTKASGAERASVMYSNAANLIIPIVSFVLGEEWVVYSCAYMSVQIVLLWTHGISLFQKNTSFKVKKIVTNINIIAIAIGLLMLITSWRLPKVFSEITASLGGMLGNVGMLIAGILMAQVEWKKLFGCKEMYRTVLMRLVVCPAVILIFLKGARHFLQNPFADQVLLISFLACMTPSAATVMQFAQLHEEGEDLAVSVNIVSTLLSIATMPIFVALY